VSEPPPIDDTPGFTAGPEHSGRRRWRNRGTVVVASLVVLGLGVLAFLRSPYFAADHISVEGAVQLEPGRVLRIGGVERGQNVVTLDTAATERRLEADPWIASASVTTDLPDTVLVRITERIPVASVETHQGWEVVAADGVVVTTTTKEPRLPMITSVVPGPDITTLGARALGAMDDRLRAGVSTLTVGIDGVTRLVLDDGVTVSYGALDEFTSKAQALAAVLAWADEGDARVEQIDISVPGAPTARLAGGALASP
jgi:cell division protein FtsQ